MNQKIITICIVFSLLMVGVVYGAYGTSGVRFCVGEDCQIIIVNYTDTIRVTIEENCIVVYYRQVGKAEFWIEAVKDCIYE